MRFRISMLILTSVVLGGYQFAIAQANHKFDGYELVDKTGNLRNKPADYRDLYQLLGTFTVLDPKGNQMHVTYASPGTAEYYRKTGKFPDGAVLVKEIFGTDHAQLTRVMPIGLREQKSGLSRSRMKNTALHRM